jgi:acyl carrier protein
VQHLEKARQRAQSVDGAEIDAITPEAGVELFGDLLRCPTPDIMVMALDLHRYAESHPHDVQTPFFTFLHRERSGRAGGRPLGYFRDELLANASPWRRRAMLEGYIAEQTALVALLPVDQIDAETSFQKIGFDSLMAVDLRTKLQHSLGLTLPGTLIFRYPTPSALATYLAEQMGISIDQEEPEAEAPAKPDLSSEEGDKIAEMLRALIDAKV